MRNPVMVSAGSGLKLADEFLPKRKRGLFRAMLLMLARQHILWWPLHPLGFAISTSSLTNGISCSVFLAWLWLFITTSSNLGAGPDGVGRDRGPCEGLDAETG